MRLIDTEMLTLFGHKLKALGKGTKEGYETPGLYEVVMEIEDAPAIDPVHAAGGCYCRECIYWANDRSVPQNCLCLETGNYTDPDDFCSRGERKEHLE